MKYVCGCCGLGDADAFNRGGLFPVTLASFVFRLMSSTSLQHLHLVKNVVQHSRLLATG